jgi:hypothetical protein
MKIKINYDNHIEIMKILYENSKILQKNNINFDGFSKVYNMVEVKQIK